MIAKATVHDNGARLARYLVTGKEGEIAALWELSGFASPDIIEAFRSVHIMAAGTHCQHPFFHIQVRNRETEFLTRDQWLIVADRIERMLGLGGQPRALAFHMDRRTGGEHMHLAFSRIDHETLTARKLPFFKRRLHTLSRELETELGLAPVCAGRASVIKYAPLRRQEEQARRLGIDIREVLESIRDCFDKSDCGRSFAAALDLNKLTLAQGERRDFVVIDFAGGVHALGKRLLGASAAQIRARFSDLPRDSLPTAEQVRQRISMVEGSRKNKAVESNSASPKVRRQPAPPPEVSAPSVRKAHAIEDEKNWAARPISSDVLPSQCQAVSPGCLQSLCKENDPASPVFEFEEAETAPAVPASPVSTETDLAGNHAEPEAGNEQPITQGSLPLADVVKKQFRALVKVLVKRTASPQPQVRRRRRGEAVGSFRSAARNVLRPITRLPGFSQTIAFLNDTLPWLHLWDWNKPAGHEFTEEPAGREGNHLSPQP